MPTTKVDLQKTVELLNHVPYGGTAFYSIPHPLKDRAELLLYLVHTHLRRYKYNIQHEVVYVQNRPSIDKLNKAL